MVVVTSTTNTPPFTTTSRHHHYLTSRPPPPFILYFRQLYDTKPPKKTCKSSNGGLLVTAYREDSGFLNKIVGALPVIGLVARLLTDTGGVGGDIVDFAEFRRRVGKNSSVNDSRAFYEFKERHGQAGEPLYVLMCCWLAAVGAGLLKSEEIFEGVARLSFANDIEFEEETFISMMTESREKRAKSRTETPTIPLEARAAKALDAIYVCCFLRKPIEAEDERLLCIMLNAVFPTVGLPTIEKIVQEKSAKTAQGIYEDVTYKEPKPISKEAMQLQLKELEFLRQNSDRD